MTTTRICQHCGGEIKRVATPHSRTFKYCGDDCRRLAGNIRQNNAKRKRRPDTPLRMVTNRDATNEGRSRERVMHRKGIRVSVKMPHEQQWGRANAKVVTSRMAKLLGVSVVCVRLDDGSYRNVAGDRVMAGERAGAQR